MLSSWAWKTIKATYPYHIDENLKDCVDTLLEIWTWENFQITINEPSYVWTLVHGDYIPANMAINRDDWSDVALLNYWTTGISNPGIDLSTFFATWSTPNLMKYE